MSKFIVKNCPAKPVKKYCVQNKAYCADCTNCLTKKIILFCEQQNMSCKGYSEKNIEASRVLSIRKEKSLMAQEILKLFEMEQV